MKMPIPTLSLLSRLGVLMCFLSVPGAVYSCSVEEIVDMAQDGAGAQAIKRVCDSADDAPQCTFNKVIQYALADMDEYDILERCGLCENPVCSTRFGECPIMGGGKVSDGGQCTCFVPQMGPYGVVRQAISGTALCNSL